MNNKIRVALGLAIAHVEATEEESMKNILALVTMLPWSDLREAYDELVTGGDHPDQAARKVAVVVDELIPLDSIVDGPAGEVLEAVDRPLVRIIVRIALRFTKRGAQAPATDPPAAA